MSRLKFLKGARRDIGDAFEWYRKSEEQLASDFADEVDIGLGEIATDAAAGHVYDEAHRFVLLKRFPYAIYFRPAGAVVTVVAVSNTAREQGYWLRR